MNLPPSWPEPGRIFPLIPLHALNVRGHTECVFRTSAEELERVILEVFFSCNVLPTSWIQVAFNEGRSRTEEPDPTRTIVQQRMHLTERVAVLEGRYFYCF